MNFTKLKDCLDKFINEYKNCIESGITKINIFTDLYVAATKAINEATGDYHQIRRAKVDAIKSAVIDKMMLFGSNEKY